MKKILLPLGTSLLFSGSYIAAKFTTFDLGPLTATLLRYSVALLFLAALLMHYELSSLRVESKDLFRLVLLGLFGIVGYHYFFFSSLRYTAVVNTAIINALSPMITGILAAIFIKERLARKNYFGIIIACAGVILLVSRGKIEIVTGQAVNLGDGLMLLAVLSWVGYSLLIKRMIKKYAVFTLTFYATLFGVIALFFLAMTEDMVGQVSGISTASIISVFYMGICASGLGYLLYNWSIKEIGPTRTSSFVYGLVPIFVAGLALLIFKQNITVIMILSAILIMSGLRFMMRK